MMIIYLIINLLFFSSTFPMRQQIEHFKERNLNEASAQSSTIVQQAKNQLFLDDKENSETTFFEDADEAAYACNLEELKKLVTEKNVNDVNRNGNPLIFSTITKAFADPDAPVEQIFNFLIEKGACINTLGPRQKMSAFEYATRLSINNQEKNLRVLHYFLNKGASPFFASPKKKSGFEITLLCAMSKEKELLFPQAYEVLKLFQSRAKTLRQAILTFNVEKVTELANEQTAQEIDAGEKPLFTTITHFTRFNCKQMLEIIKILVEKKVDPNEKIIQTNFIQTETGFERKIYLNTYLMIATIISIFQKNSQMIPILLDAGASPHLSFGSDLPSAFSLADKAAHLSAKEIEEQRSQGFSKEIDRIVKNKHIAAEIIDLFKKSQKKL